MNAFTFSAKDAAGYLGIPVSAVYRYAESGELACVRTCGKVLERIWRGRRQTYVKSGRLKFSQADLEAWVQAHRVAPHPSSKSATSAAAPALPPASGEYQW